MNQKTLRLQQLKDNEAKYRSMFENAVGGIYQSTPDGHYLAVNFALAKMYGYDSAEELLDRISDIQKQIYIDPSLREQFKREIEQTGQVQGLEYQVRRSDGRVIWVSESARVVYDAAGEARFYEGFIENITARKETEAAHAQREKQMIQAQKMEAIGILASGIAHDFNNVLFVILGHAELALGDPHIQGMAQRNLQMIFKSANRAKDLVKRILTFSHCTETERQPVKLGGILKESIKLLNASLPSSIEINLTLRTDDDVVMADITEMHQVIMNLGTNAAHAMRLKGGRLEYELQKLEFDADAAACLPPLQPGPHICLTVRDTGHGISRAVMENIFDPFFTTKSVGEGTGLGLALARKIVVSSGGHITVESQEGRGTTFLIYLPQSHLTPVPVAVGGQPLPGRRERILVVDDEMYILDLMQQHLRKMDYRVITRADSKAALETIHREPEKFDLVITDHTMPGLQGSELAESIGRIRPDLPVILFTGLNHPPDFASSPYAVRRAVIKKPVDFVELSHRMRAFLDPALEPGLPAS